MNEQSEFTPPVTGEEDAEEFADLDRGSLGYDPIIAAANHNHKLIRMMYDYPGINGANLVSARKSDLSDAEHVVGIDVEGEACAFPLKSMNLEDSHIVNTVIGTTPVSVTYCPLVNCVRVFSKAGEQAIPLRLGGLNEEDEMVLLLDGERYDQSSLRIPLTEHEFSRSTFGEWKKMHPTTKVFQRESATRT